MVTSPRLAEGNDAIARKQAIDWHLAHAGGELTPEQRAAFEAWRVVPANAEALARIGRISTDVRMDHDNPDVIKKSQEIFTWMRTERRRKRRLYAFAAAASVVLFVALSARFADWSLPPYERESNARIYATTVGQRSTVPLADGSGLTLDTNTAVAVSYGEQRSIQLQRGQALFDVMKGDARPFVVNAGDRRVTATGTSFDVRFDKDLVEVTLVEGSVTVDQTAPDGRWRPSTKLRPGEKLAARVGGVATVQQVNPDTVTSWTSGTHVFRNTPLRDAVAEVNRYADSPLILRDPALETVEVNGVFSTGRPAEFAKMIAELNAIDLIVDQNGTLYLQAEKR